MDMPELYEVMAHVAAHGPGVPASRYTPEWATANGLPTVCERCGLPFDRTGSARHIPKATRDALVAEGRAAEAVNTYCVRLLGNRELWTCEGKAIR
jgi:hypothetical protein